MLLFAIMLTLRPLFLAAVIAAAPAADQIHAAPLADALISAAELYIIPPLAVAIGTWLAAKFGAKLSADRQAKLADLLSSIADKAAIFAAEHARTAVATKGPLDVNVGDPRVAAFGNFMIAQAGDLLKKLNVDSKPGPDGKLPAATVDTLNRLALARLPASGPGAITAAVNTVPAPATPSPKP